MNQKQMGVWDKFVKRRRREDAYKVFGKTEMKKRTTRDASVEFARKA